MMAKNPTTNTYDLSLLHEIIENLKFFIEEYYFNKPPLVTDYKVSPMIPGRYHAEFIQAWIEVSQVIDEVLVRIKSGDFRDLNECGLANKQLLLKYKFCKEALDSARDWHTKEKMDEKPKDTRWYKKWFSYCKRFLQGSNIVVGSLSKIIPGAECIKEGIDGIIYLSEIGTETPE